MILWSDSFAQFYILKLSTIAFFDGLSSLIEIFRYFILKSLILNKNLLRYLAYKTLNLSKNWSIFFYYTLSSINNK